jgi:hypothetical protein
MELSASLTALTRFCLQANRRILKDCLSARWKFKNIKAAKVEQNDYEHIRIYREYAID